MLNREKLLNGTSFLPFEEVDVPELGGVIGVQGMTACDAIEYHNALGGGDVQGIEQLAKLVVRSVVDENKDRIFQDDEWETIVKGSHAWPIAALNRVALVAMRLNQGSTEGNSEAIPVAASSSGSRSRSGKRLAN